MRAHLVETARLALWLLAGALAVLVAVAWSEARRWPEPLPATVIWCEHEDCWR